MKKIVISSIAVLVLGVIAVFVVPRIFEEDLESVLAEALNVDKENLIINLPPSPGRVPGEVLLPHKGGYVSYLRNSNFEALAGEEFKLRTKLTSSVASSSIGAGGVLEHVFENLSHFDVDLVVEEGRILELSIPEIKNLLKDNKMIRAAVDSRKELIVLHRAIEGIVSYEIRATDEKGAEILADTRVDAKILSTRNDEITIEGETASSQHFSLLLSTPVIFAFEALSVNYVINDLSGDDLDVVVNTVAMNTIDLMSENNTARIKRDELEMLERKDRLERQEWALEEMELNSGLESMGAVPASDIRWGLVTIGSAHFDGMATMDVPEAIKSLSIFRKTFEGYDPIFVQQLVSSEDDVVTEQEVLDWTINFTMGMFSNPDSIDYLIVYYTGHGLSLPNGELALLTGDAKKDYAENALKSMTPKSSAPYDGILLAETVYSSIEMAGVPFTLFIDACYPNDEMQEALNRVAMSVNEDGGNLVYHGENDIITDEMQTVHSAQYDIGNRFPYRTTTNPVIFSTKPGAKAKLRPDPNSFYSMKVSPIAERFMQYEAMLRTISLNELVKLTIDSKGGLGEISLEGTVSWSSLDSLSYYTSDIYIGKSSEPQ